MKKTRRWNKTLAALMAIVMLVSAMVFVVPANAETDEPESAYTYSAKRVDPVKMKLDGKMNISEGWNSVAESKFGGALNDITDNAGTVKMLWGYTGEGDEKVAYIYYFITYTDIDNVAVGGWDGDCVVIGMDESGEDIDGVTIDSSTKNYVYRTNSIATVTKNEANALATNVSHAVVRDGKNISIEARATFKVPEYAVKDHVLSVGIMTSLCTGKTENGVDEETGETKYKNIYVRGHWGENGDIGASIPSKDFGRVTLTDELASTYKAKRVNADAMVIDGTAGSVEPWDDVEWTDDFTGLTTDNQGREFTNPGRAKMLWSYTGEKSAPTAASLYALITFTDTNSVFDQVSGSDAWASDGFYLGMSETAENGVSVSDKDYTSASRRMNTQYTSVTGTKTYGTPSWATWVVRRVGNEVFIEVKMDFINPANATDGDLASFAVLLQPSSGTTKNDYKRGLWGGINPTGDSTNYGTVALVDELMGQAVYEVPKTENGGLSLTDGKIGEDAVWDSAEWVYFNGNAWNKVGNQGRAKFAWGVENGQKNLYVLVNYSSWGIEDKADWNRNSLYLTVDESGVASGGAHNVVQHTGSIDYIYRAGYVSLLANSTREGLTSEVKRTNITDNVNTATTVVDVWAEIKLTFKDQNRIQNNGIVSVGVGVTSGDTSSYTRTAWGFAGGTSNVDIGAVNVGLLGDLKLMPNEKTVTIMNGDTIVDAPKVDAGSQYTLPAAVDMGAGKQFIGWKNGVMLYKAGSKVTVNADMTFEAVAIDLTMEKGAAVRLNATTGMRWISYVNADAVQYITNNGTLIVPTDNLGSAELTHAGLAAAGLVKDAADGYIDVSNNNTYAKDVGEMKQFNGSIGSILKENYDREFVAVGYVEIAYADGDTAYFYADYEAACTARTVEYVAQKALDDTEGGYTNTQRGVLEKFAENYDASKYTAYEAQQ